MKFADSVLSKNEMKGLKSGYGSSFKIMCGRSIYYGGGFSIISYGQCAGTNIGACNTENSAVSSYQGAVSVNSYGCYTVGTPGT
jgi:hypothetical protein